MSPFFRTSAISASDTEVAGKRRVLTSPVQVLAPLALILLLQCQTVLAQDQPRTVVAAAETAITFGADERAALQGTGAVVVARSPGAAFEIMYSSSGGTGAAVVRGLLFGPAFMGQKFSRAAVDIYAENAKLVDPIPIVAQAFFDKLSLEVTADRMRLHEQAVAQEGGDALRAIAPQGLAVVVRTSEWRIEIVPEAGMGQQRVHYGATAWAVQLPEGKTSWRATCRATTPEPISGNELRRDEGRLLRRKLAECAAACADELWTSYTGTGDPLQTPR